MRSNLLKRCVLLISVMVAFLGATGASTSYAAGPKNQPPAVAQQAAVAAPAVPPGDHLGRLEVVGHLLLVLLFMILMALAARQLIRHRSKEATGEFVRAATESIAYLLILIAVISQ